MSTITTPPFRGSFVNLVTPRAIGDSEDKKYSMLVVLDPADKETKTFLRALNQAITEACVAKFGKDMPRGNLKHFPITDGDDDKPELDGKIRINCKNSRRPGVIDLKGNKIFDEEQLYSGAWYRASVSVFAWEGKTFGKGVSVSLNNVLWLKNDERFAGGASAEEDFKDLLGDDTTEEVDDLLS